MQGVFIQALTFAPPTVLGRKLLPFSSWHGLVLEAAGSAFIVGGTSTISEMLAGVWVCSRSFTAGFSAATDAGAVCKWSKNLKHPDFHAAIKSFRDYISASLAVPAYWGDDAENKTIRAPSWWHMVTFAMRELNLPEAQAWDFPVARLLCHQACVAESNGNNDLMSAEDLQGINTLRQDAESAARETRG